MNPSEIESSNTLEIKMLQRKILLLENKIKESQAIQDTIIDTISWLVRISLSADKSHRQIHKKRGRGPPALAGRGIAHPPSLKDFA